MLGLAQGLLEATFARYEREKQPAVIARAGELFTDVTAGRYVQLVAHEDDRAARHGIDAISAHDERVDSGSLSRGTAEQLYLCLRLGLAETHAERTVSLPFVLDDVLVNFDPGRATAVARAIVLLSRSHQVLAFTCHPHIVEVFRAADPACTVIELPLAEVGRHADRSVARPGTGRSQSSATSPAANAVASFHPVTTATKMTRVRMCTPVHHRQSLPIS